MFKFFNHIFCILVIMNFVSCGDLFTKGEKEKSSYNQFSTCEFDTEAVTKIMTKNIEGELLCLESNLYLFIEVVKSERPGSLQLSALKTYIKENMKNVDEKTIEILGAIFDLNSLLLGDDSNFISRKNVKTLAKTLIKFNKIVVEGNIYEYFTAEEKVDFYEHNKRKSVIFSSLNQLGSLFNEIVVDNKNKIIIDDFLEKFRNIENKEILKYVSSLLFLKKAILGGQEDVLTSLELKRLTTILGDIGKIAFDFVNLPDTSTSKSEEEEEIFKILKEDLETTYKNFLYKNSNSEVIVTYDKIVDIVEIFFPDLLRYIQYKSTFLKAKEILVGSSSENFTGVEISTLLTDFLYKNVSKGVFMYRSYMNREGILEKANRILHDFLNLVTFSSEENNYIASFNRVVKNYRFYKGSKFSPLFDFDYKRNPRGLFDILLYEDIVKRVYAHYGTLDTEVTGDYYLTQKQLVSFMEDFKEIFEGEGFILPGRAASTAETMTLMTSLFHFQSNGDSKIEIPEFVEFIITLTTSLNLSSDMYTYLQERCELDSKKRVMPECYRRNFQDFLNYQVESGERIEEFVPKLRDYLNDLGDQRNIDEYLVSTARFSRSCSRFDDGSEVPMKEGDFFVSWAGLLAVEQSMLKFDENNSGLLEPREVDEAYKIYKGAIKGMIPVKFLKRYSKVFFRYLVMFKRVPDIPKISGFYSLWKAAREGWHFAKFIFRGEENQLASANRMTFASVLKIIAENSPANQENPYPCHTLR